MFILLKGGSTPTTKRALPFQTRMSLVGETPSALF